MLSLFLICAIGVEPASALEPENITYDYVEAYKEHIEEEKPLLVLVWAEWCGPCKEFKRHLKPKVFRRLKRQNFCYAEIKEDDVCAKCFQVDSYPFIMLYYKKNGESRSVRFNATEHDRLFQFLSNLTGDG